MGAGPEAANNAAAGGAFILMLTLGIPPNVIMSQASGSADFGNFVDPVQHLISLTCLIIAALILCAPLLPSMARKREVIALDTESMQERVGNGPA